MSIINFDRYYHMAFQIAYIASYFHLCYMKSLFPPTLQTAMHAIALFHFSQANECEMIYHLFPISSLWLLENCGSFQKHIDQVLRKRKKIHFFSVFREYASKVYSFFPFLNGINDNFLNSCLSFSQIIK